MKVKVIGSQLTEYTRWVEFQYEGETYEVKIEVGKNFTDFKLYQDKVEVVDLPDWLGKDVNLIWDIDNLGWELEQDKIKVGA
jgi:CYTH domain-containing protein